jgi:hypothetical protein
MGVKFPAKPRERNIMPQPQSTPQSTQHTGKTFRQRLLWFVGLWLLGVAGTALLVLPFHLLIAAAMRH